MASAGGARAGLGGDGEFSVGLAKCEGLREGLPNGQLGTRRALEMMQC